MHAVVRNYSGSGASELIDLLEQRLDEVESLIRSVQGLSPTRSFAPTMAASR